MIEYYNTEDSMIQNTLIHLLSFIPSINSLRSSGVMFLFNKEYLDSNCLKLYIENVIELESQFQTWSG